MLCTKVFLTLFNRFIVAMGNNLDVFYNARQCHQCIFPCIRTCTYAGKPVWYNFDGMESVQPLVQLYRAHSGRRIKKFTGTLEELNYNEEISQQLQKGDDLFIMV